ncbi:unnamed protein product, partial [Brassica oleracea]
FVFYWFRFFLCSNKVMQVALGRSASDEIRPCIFKAFKLLHGVAGLLITNMPKEEVESLFNAYENSDFSRTRSTAVETVCTVEVLSDFVVCEEGKPLSQKSSRILCPLGIKLAISNSTWSADGALMTLSLTEKAWISRMLKQNFDDQRF